MRVLVTGSSGQLGSELRRLTEDAAQRSNTEPAVGEFTFVDRATMPLDQPETFRALFEEVRPDVLINAGAYTAVDKAESEPELAYAVNTTAVGVLATLCKEFGTLLIHISTDYVFDGTSNRPYLDTDPVNPLGVYGASKEAGEKLALGFERALVIRTSWVYSYYGRILSRRCSGYFGRRKPWVWLVIRWEDQPMLPTWLLRSWRLYSNMLHCRFWNVYQTVVFMEFINMRMRVPLLGMT